MNKQTIPAEQIALRIRHFRGEKVLLDFDLACLYGVTTKALNQAVKRNRDRFPNDFMFQLTTEEVLILRSQTVISSPHNTTNQQITKHRSQIVTSLLQNPYFQWFVDSPKPKVGTSKVVLPHR